MINPFTVFFFFPFVAVGLLYWPVRVVWGYAVLRRHGDGEAYRRFSRHAMKIFVALVIAGYVFYIAAFRSPETFPRATELLASGKLGVIAFLLPVNLLLSNVFSRDRALRAYKIPP